MLTLSRPLTIFHAIGLTILAFIVTTPVLQLFATILTMIQGRAYSDAFEQVVSQPINLGTATFFGVGVSLLLGKAWFEPTTPWTRLLSLRPTSLRTMALAILCGFALQFPLTELGNLSELLLPVSLEQKRFIQEVMSPKGGLQWFLSVLAFVFVVPICEEMLFRGFLLRGLHRTYGLLIAVFLTAVLFGISHFRVPTTVFPAAVAGFVLGFLVHATGSILPAISLHAAVNAVPLLLPNRLVQIRGFNTIQQGVCHLPLLLLLGTSFISVFAIFMLFRAGKMNNGDERHRPFD